MLICNIRIIYFKQNDRKAKMIDIKANYGPLRDFNMTEDVVSFKF